MVRIPAQVRCSRRMSYPTLCKYLPPRRSKSRSGWPPCSSCCSWLPCRKTSPNSCARGCLRWAFSCRCSPARIELCRPCHRPCLLMPHLWYLWFADHTAPRSLAGTAGLCALAHQRLFAFARAGVAACHARRSQHAPARLPMGGKSQRMPPPPPLVIRATTCAAYLECNRSRRDYRDCGVRRPCRSIVLILKGVMGVGGMVGARCHARRMP